ncbi:molybdopterin-guanine dinucleotide biosynthesis protein MobB, partial [Klebsiella pneumoniae]|uniref:molybdopterin-guanine dinucleotide biosynthesis protein MobB n=1 Tax=Klebsiella pneumoniae TaxID=573 RepID=UPI000DFAACA4
ASEQRWALMTETPEKPELDLTWLVSRMDASKLDLVLVEGFKHEPVPKILLFGKTGHRVEELVIDEHTIAVASDVSIATSLPLLDLNDVPQIATFIVSWLERQ